VQASTIFRSIFGKLFAGALSDVERQQELAQDRHRSYLAKRGWRPVGILYFNDSTSMYVFRIHASTVGMIGGPSAPSSDCAYVASIFGGGGPAGPA
jgi:hypothetical protein